MPSKVLEGISPSQISQKLEGSNAVMSEDSFGKLTTQFSRLGIEKGGPTSSTKQMENGIKTKIKLDQFKETDCSSSAETPKNKKHTAGALTETVDKKTKKKKKRKKGQKRELPEGQLTPYQGTRKAFGFYLCEDCKHSWASAHSWANCYQKCNLCNAAIYPHAQRPLLKGKSPNNNRPHLQDLCQKCHQLGHSCGGRFSQE